MTCHLLKNNLIKFCHVEGTKCWYHFFIHTIKRKTIGSLSIYNLDVLSVFDFVKLYSLALYIDFINKLIPHI